MLSSVDFRDISEQPRTLVSGLVTGPRILLRLQVDRTAASRRACLLRWPVHSANFVLVGHSADIVCAINTRLGNPSFVILAPLGLEEVRGRSLRPLSS